MSALLCESWHDLRRMSRCAMLRALRRLAERKAQGVTRGALDRRIFAFGDGGRGACRRSAPAVAWGSACAGPFRRSRGPRIVRADFGSAERAIGTARIGGGGVLPRWSRSGSCFPLPENSLNLPSYRLVREAQRKRKRQALQGTYPDLVQFGHSHGAAARGPADQPDAQLSKKRNSAARTIDQ